MKLSLLGRCPPTLLFSGTPYYVATIISYFTETCIDHNDILLLISVIISPPLLFANLCHTWIYNTDSFYRKLDAKKQKLKHEREPRDYDLSSNQQKIALVSTLTRLIIYGSMLTILYFAYPNGPLFQPAQDEYGWSIFSNILSGFVVCIAAWTSCQLGGWSSLVVTGLGSITAEIILTVYSNFLCSTAPNPIGYSAPSLTFSLEELTICGYYDGPFDETIITIIFCTAGIIGWVITCRHNLANIPLKYLEWGDLYSTRVITSSVGASGVLVTINRRRNNNAIKDFRSRVDKATLEKQRKEIADAQINLARTVHLSKTTQPTVFMNTKQKVNNAYYRDQIKPQQEKLKTMRVRFQKDQNQTMKSMRSIRSSRSRITSTQSNNLQNSSIDTHIPNQTVTDEDLDNIEELGKTPYIFICPTLYQETYDEMKTLVTSLLRLNQTC